MAEMGYSRFGWVFILFGGLEQLAFGLQGIFGTGNNCVVPPCSTYPPPAVNDLTYTFRELGISILIIGVLLIAISLKSFRRGEKWAWIAVLAEVLLFAGLDLTITYAQN